MTIDHRNFFDRVSATPGFCSASSVQKIPALVNFLQRRMRKNDDRGIFINLGQIAFQHLRCSSPTIKGEPLGLSSPAISSMRCSLVGHAFEGPVIIGSDAVSVMNEMHAFMIKTVVLRPNSFSQYSPRSRYNHAHPWHDGLWYSMRTYLSAMIQFGLLPSCAKSTKWQSPGLVSTVLVSARRESDPDPHFWRSGFPDMLNMGIGNIGRRWNSGHFPQRPVQPGWKVRCCKS